MGRIRRVPSTTPARTDYRLPIGNLTSQFWANVYLNEVDQFVKRRLRCRHYLRYVDDMILLGSDPVQLQDCKNAIEGFLASALRLRLRPDTKAPFRVDRGVDFVGWKTFWNRRVVRRQTLGNCSRRLRSFERSHVRPAWNGAAQRIDLVSSRPAVAILGAALASYCGHLRHGAAWRQWCEMVARHDWFDALFRRDADNLWRLRERWPKKAVAGRFSRQYGHLVLCAGDDALVFCQVGRFVEFYGPQRERAAQVLRLLRIEMKRGGYGFCVGFPGALRADFLSRAVRAGWPVVDVRALAGAGPLRRTVTTLWLPAERGAAGGARG